MAENGGSIMMNDWKVNFPSIRPQNDANHVLWWHALSYEQKEFIISFYKLTCVIPEIDMLRAYQERDVTHNHPDWPASRLNPLP